MKAAPSILRIQPIYNKIHKPGWRLKTAWAHIAHHRQNIFKRASYIGGSFFYSSTAGQPGHQTCGRSSTCPVKEVKGCTNILMGRRSVRTGYFTKKMHSGFEALEKQLCLMMQIIPTGTSCKILLSDAIAQVYQAMEKQQIRRIHIQASPFGSNSNILVN
jgi:hypothetical protein